MIEAGVPVVPGTQENLKSVEEAVELCNKIGYPVMLKASMGGGGKGMRLIHSAEEVEEGIRLPKASHFLRLATIPFYLRRSSWKNLITLNFRFWATNTET